MKTKENKYFILVLALFLSSSLILSGCGESRDNTKLNNGSVSGFITNAVDGLNLPDVTVNLRAGENVTSGTILATTITTIDEGGNYSFSNLATGNYTAELIKSGFVTAYSKIICVGGTNTKNQNYSLSPVLVPGQIRIVLNWGETPPDLDSHLTGPKAEGDISTNSFEDPGRFHLFWIYPFYTYLGIEYSNLNTDDSTSYGPETFTIKTQLAGVYRYSIHDYTNKDATESSPSNALSLSNATVRVYNSTGLIRTFNIPTNVNGNLWTVFELNGSTITPINTISYVVDTTSVRSLPNSNDSNVIKNNGTK